MNKTLFFVAAVVLSVGSYFWYKSNRSDTAMYVAAAYISEGVSASARLKIAVEQYHAETGELPASNKQIGAPEPKELASVVVKGIEVTTGGVIVIRYDKRPGMDGGIVKLVPEVINPSGFFRWRCVTPSYKDIQSMLEACRYDPSATDSGLSNVSASRNDETKPEEKRRVPMGTWTAKLELGKGTGQVALDCVEIRGQATCRLFWVFEEIPFEAKIEDDHLKLYQEGSEKDALKLLLKDGEPHRYFGTSVRLREPIVFARKDANEYREIASPDIPTSEYNKHHDGTTLKPLPIHWHGWFVDSSVDVFLSDSPVASQTRRRLLEHRALGSGALRKVYERYGAQQGPDTVATLHAIARHRAASPGTLKDIFKAATKSGDKELLNAVAHNPNMPRNLEGPEVTRRDTAKRAPDSVQTGNTSPEMLGKLASTQSTVEDLENIARDPNATEQTLMILANTQYKDKHQEQRVLHAILRQTRDTPAIHAALRRLAEDMYNALTVAEDKRVPVDVRGGLIKSDVIAVREALARNVASSLEELKMLAEDEYAAVSTAARNSLRWRFRAESKAFISSLPPLTELNQATNLKDELISAIADNDAANVKRLLPKLERTGVAYGDIDPGPMLKSGNKEMAAALFQVNKPSFHILVQHMDFTPEWLAFLLDIGALQSANAHGMFVTCLTERRLDYLQVLLDHGYDLRSGGEMASNLLYTVIRMRYDDGLDFLIVKGVEASTTGTDRSKITPVDLAMMSGYFKAVDLLDTTGKYRDSVSELRRKYRPDQDSPLIGSWSNYHDGFNTVALSFYADGTGRMSGAVTAAFVVWKELANSRVAIIPYADGMLQEGGKIVSSYKVTDNELTLDAGNGRQHSYLRYFDMSQEEFLRTYKVPRNSKFFGSWAGRNGQIRVRMDADGTGRWNDAHSLLWKQESPDKATILVVRGNQLRQSQPESVQYDSTRDILISRKGREKVELHRVTPQG